MAESRGRLFVIQAGDGATAEVFTTIAGFRSNSLTLNNEAVDVTTKSSAPWRKLLADAGLRSMSLDGSGIFGDTASEETLRSQADAATIDNYRILDTDTGDYWEGGFLVTNYSRSGEYNGAVEFSCAFESSGTVTFTAA